MKVAKSKGEIPLRVCCPNLAGSGRGSLGFILLRALAIPIKSESEVPPRFGLSLSADQT